MSLNIKMDFVTISKTGITSLARPIVGVKDVTVVRFVLPKQYYNFKQSKIGIYADSEMTVVFPAGYYRDIQAVAEMLENVVQSDGISFVGDMETSTITVTIDSPRHYIDLSKYLSKRLHVSERIRGITKSSAPVKLMKQYFYLQADFIEPQLVNRSSMRLLYVAHDAYTSEYVKTPCYIPVCKDYLDTINVWITDENNEPIKFIDGKPLIQLHFRHKY